MSPLPEPAIDLAVLISLAGKIGRRRRTFSEKCSFDVFPCGECFTKEGRMVACTRDSSFAVGYRRAATHWPIRLWIGRMKAKLPEAITRLQPQ